MGSLCIASSPLKLSSLVLPGLPHSPVLPFHVLHVSVSPTGLLNAQGIGTLELSTELIVMVHVWCVNHFQQQELLYKMAVSLVMWMLRHEECAVEERSQGNSPHEGW